MVTAIVAKLVLLIMLSAKCKTRALVEDARFWFRAPTGVPLRRRGHTVREHGGPHQERLVGCFCQEINVGLLSGATRRQAATQTLLSRGGARDYHSCK